MSNKVEQNQHTKTVSVTLGADGSFTTPQAIIDAIMPPLGEAVYNVSTSDEWGDIDDAERLGMQFEITVAITPFEKELPHSITEALRK